MRRKSLLIGINYTGSQHALRGCQQDVRNMAQFLDSRGYANNPRDRVVLTDAADPSGPFFPSGRNILAAMAWLVSEPETYCFLHYSGHGGQVRDPDGDRESGFDDTIVPFDFETNGQIDSDTLHRHVVSKLPQNSTLFVVFDCCHSGSALELPYVYRSDENGNVGLVDSVKQGLNLVLEANNLLNGAYGMNSAAEAKRLFAGASSFFKGITHRNDPAPPDGLQAEQFEEDWSREGKTVFMFSGCRDDQTSADAVIGGSAVGAMSWAFLQTMQIPRQLSFVQILQNTRTLLKQNYNQVPQLSVGYQVDLNRPFVI